MTRDIFACPYRPPCILALPAAHWQAQYNVGVQLEMGLGVTKNERQAAEWYNRAVAAGQVCTKLQPICVCLIFFFVGLCLQPFWVSCTAV